MISLKSKDGGSPPDRRRGQAVTEPSASRAVTKPVPAAQISDPRGYQITQLKRRFNPKEITLDDGTTSLSFRLTPSDPDFAFDLDHLECDVRIPKDYPGDVPRLHVRNKNIPRGFSLNIERGWDRLVKERPGATLLSLLNALDKNLESFLSEQKVETVKLVTFKDTRHLDPAQGSPSTGALNAAEISPAPKPYSLEPSYTRDQIAEAKARRAQETRQLEARMGRLTLYKKSADGVVYTLPIEPRKRSELPSGLQGVRTLHLIIPLLYPLQQLRVQLNEVESAEAEPIEELFVQKAAQQKQMTLMNHLNYLAENLNILAKLSQLAFREKAAQEAAQAIAERGATTDGESVATTEDDERKHIKIIPRPPEWTSIQGAGQGSSEEDDSYDSGDESDGGVDLNAANPAMDLNAERGTSMSFPGIELHGIEILQVSILSLGVKCERCKTINEVTGLKHGVEKTGSCRKCASGFAVRYRQQLVHQSSVRAAFLDVGGCTVADMLPSTFVPTCAKCSTPSPGLVSVRGETTTNVCRECHSKFTFKIPEVKFLALTPGSLAPPPTGPRRKQEKLGLHAGEPLPDRGACSHYRKSYRWFRFSCCNRVYPCDRCHDEAESHLNEWANRMICGYCSREQKYDVDACGFCGRSVIGKKGKGFWEGGKGTRDRRMMNRNDKRKYRRVGGGEAAKKE